MDGLAYCEAAPMVKGVGMLFLFKRLAVVGVFKESSLSSGWTFFSRVWILFSRGWAFSCNIVGDGERERTF